MSAPANDNRSAPDAQKLQAGKSQCPICKAPTVMDYRPFCSRRCADLDLSRWLNGVYSVPARPDEEMDESEIDAMIIELDSALHKDKS